MEIWKFTIKPSSQKGYDAFRFCKENSYIGLGWSGAYKDKSPYEFNEAKTLLKERYNKIPYQAKHLVESVKENDHLWIHKSGKYYLCIAGKDSLFGRNITENFLNYDLGHVRNVTWIEVPEIFVSGAIQRGIIAQRMIQKIKISEAEKTYSSLLAKKLLENPTWLPVIDDEIFSKSLKGIDIYELFSMMSPDDLEDIVSFYLQSKGWFLTKSTCYRSKPFFEFSMQNTKNETCYVQVKSGKAPNKLAPIDYKEHISERSYIYLFSTHKDAYPGESIERVITISHKELALWLIENCWAITLPLKTRLWLLVEKES
jgi:hypothetical protein